jgi:Carboxypeptidase regulatory-like domain
MRLFNLFRISLACLLMAGLVHAQGVGASGEIQGTVTDPSGAVISNGTVVVTDLGKGLKRTAPTGSDGTYLVAGLPAATYSVSAAKTGFQTEVVKSVTVHVGETVVLDFHMKVSQVSAQVEVTTEPPVVDTEKSHQANVINEQYIRELPINRRDYLTFTLLAPAVSDSTRLASDQDFRVKQTPQSGLSFYGSNGRGNSVTVDGGEANDDSGGVRLNESQDAVQEFQINRSNYGAELGGASGATINIVSKSGTNDLHGSLYGFFRNDALDAANPFSFSQALQPGQTFNPAQPDVFGHHVKDSLTREQFGGTVGFPITKDKTFLFGGFEGLMADAQNAVPLLGQAGTTIFRPDNGQFSGNNQVAILNGLATLPGNPSVPCISRGTNPPISLPAAICAATLRSLLTVNPAANPVNQFIVNQFENNGGLFPYNTRLFLASVRMDHQFSETNQVFLRYSFGHDREENPDVTSLTGFSRGSSVHTLDHTLLGSWFHQFSPKTINDLHLQWNYVGFNVIPNVPGEVGLDVPGFGNFGSQIFIPNLTILRRYEIADNVTLIRGKHSMKFGGSELYRGNHSESHTFFPGRFVFGNLPGGVLSPCFQAPALACGLSGVNPVAINALQSAILPSPASPLLAGAPQFYQQGFGSPTYSYPRPFTSFYWQDTWQVKSNLTFNYGVRYELDQQYGPLNTDKNNFAPRVSFAWDPFKDQKTVVRAGYGIFYSPTYGHIVDVVQTLGLVNGVRQIAQVFVPLTGAPGNPSLTSAAIFQTLFAQGKVQCTTPAPGNAACIAPADLTQFGINITHTGPVPPLSVIFSGQPGYRSPYAQQAEFGIEHQIGRGMSISASGIYVHTIGLPVAVDVNDLPAPLVSTVLANGKTVAFRAWNAPQCLLNLSSCFVNPLILQADQYSSLGSSLYEGAIFEFNKRFSNHFSLLANYTFSKAFDTTTDFNSDFGPVDNTNLAGERALSNFDQRHKLVMLAVFDTGKGGASGASRLFANFQLAPIYRYNSGHPFNVLAGADVNGDRHSTNDRPIGAARNTGLGPNFQSFDMRLTRRIKVTERSELQLMAEGFNIFNRTNFASVNNVVGPSFGLLPGFTTFNVKGSAARPATAPLGFTSAFPMRQFQFAARMVF